MITKSFPFFDVYLVSSYGRAKFGRLFTLDEYFLYKPLRLLYTESNLGADLKDNDNDTPTTFGDCRDIYTAMFPVLNSDKK